MAQITVQQPVRPPLVEEQVDLEKVRAAPLEFLETFTRKYGTVFRYQAGPWNALVVNDPDCVHRILKADRKRYTKLGTPDLMMLKPMLGEGLMTSDGALWKAQRDQAAPSFNRRVVSFYVPEMVHAIEQTAHRWRAFSAGNDAHDIEKEMNSLTLQIVVKCLFGFDLEDQTGQFSEAVETMNKAMAHFDGSGHDMRKEFDAALGRLHAIVHGIVLKRHIVASTGEQNDLLSQLMDESTGRPLFDRIFTFVMAGHETTAKSLCWTFFLLSQHPEVEERLLQEVSGLSEEELLRADFPGALTYTWAVLQEALRLYPPVWSMTRIALEDGGEADVQIDRDSLILISPYILHRHPDYWRDPLVFNPDRFLNVEHSPHSYLPFSDGPRICIGRIFAQTEGVQALARLVREFRLELKPGQTIEPEALITLRPKEGMPMIIQRR